MKKSLFAMAMAVLTASCTHSNLTAPRAPAQAEVLPVCAAFRGNGDRIFSTMAAFSRYVEHYGPVDAISGSSSGAVIAFFYESMMKNPLWRECSGGPCSSEEAALRMALMLKSFEGYTTTLLESDEIKGLFALPRLWNAIQNRGLVALVDHDARAAFRSLRALLSSPEYRSLVNPDIWRTIETTDIALLKARLGRIFALLKNSSSLTGGSSDVLFQTGLIDMRAFARFLGRIGNFYAGYGPSDFIGWTRFFDTCATPSAGKTWGELTQGTDCGRQFSTLVTRYSHNLSRMKQELSISREREPVGGTLPALVSVSVIKGADQSRAFRDEQRKYDRLEPAAFHPPADNVRIGYWGRASHLERLARNPMGFTDWKTRHFETLGEGTWETALYHTTAEPGFAPVLAYDDATMTAGGWMDSASTLALRNIGCQQIVYFTRRDGEEAGFARKITRFLGLPEDDQKALFFLERNDQTPSSALGLSLEQADAIWCTNWDAFKSRDVQGLVRDAFNAPLQTNVKFSVRAFRPYPNASTRTGLRGCDPQEREPFAEP